MLDIETISRAKKEVHGDMSYAIVRNEKLTRAEVMEKELIMIEKQKIILIKILIQQEHI